MKFVLVLTFGIIMVEIHLPANRLLLICKCRFWRFLKVDRVKSTFIDLLKKIDQIDRIDQIDFYAVPKKVVIEALFLEIELKNILESKTVDQ